MGVPMCSSASPLFGTLGVKSLTELSRTACYSAKHRIKSSSNTLLNTEVLDETPWSCDDDIFAALMFFYSLLK